MRRPWVRRSLRVLHSRARSRALSSPTHTADAIPPLTSPSLLAGVMMGMMQLSALGGQDAAIKETMDAIQAAMMQGKLEELKAAMPSLLEKLKA